MSTEWDRKPIWRHSIWQAQSPVGPQRWPLKATILLLGALSVAGWGLLGGAVHILMTAVY